MISLNFKADSDQRLVLNLEAKTRRVQEALQEKMDEILYQLLAGVQEKLSGEVLQTRSGNLLKSARVEEAKAKGNTISGRVVVGGGLAGAYAAVQEYGGRRQYDIYPKTKQALAFFPAESVAAAVGGSIVTRVSKGGGATFTGVPVKSGPTYIKARQFRYKLGARAGTLKPEKQAAFGKLGGIVVKHVVHPPLPERSYIRSTAKEMSQRIYNQLQVAMSESVR